MSGAKHSLPVKKLFRLRPAYESIVNVTTKLGCKKGCKQLQFSIKSLQFHLHIIYNLVGGILFVWQFLAIP